MAVDGRNASLGELIRIKVLALVRSWFKRRMSFQMNLTKGISYERI